ncbi:hypothetical protein ACFX1X_023663 [Malus domestica]
MSTGILTGWPLQGQVKALQGHCICLGFWRNGELLFGYGQKQAISYKPNTQKITQQFRVYGPLRPFSESLVSIINARDDQNMLFDIVKESDDPTLQQPSSS